MHNANQMMALGCIMILFALTIGIASVLQEHWRENAEIEWAIQQDMLDILQVTRATDALHQAIHYTVCTMQRVKWSTDDLVKMINETVEHAIHGVHSSMCPIYR
jgi:hypothetical protein